MTSVDDDEETIMEKKKTKKGNDGLDDALLCLYNLLDSFFIVVAVA